MIFGKDQQEFDFDSYREDVSSAADQLVDAVNKYEPYKKKYDQQASGNLQQSASLFFKAAADALDKNSNRINTAEETQPSVGEQLKQAGLDKFASKAGQSARNLKEDATKKSALLMGMAGDSATRAQEAVKNAKLDKKLSGAVDTASGVLSGAVSSGSSALKDAKLDKKLASVSDTVSSSIKDAKLDKKLASLNDTLSSSVKDAKLDKKLANLSDTISSSVKDAKLDKKLASLSTAVTTSARDAKLDKKLADLTESLSGAVKDARLDKKLAGVAENVAPVAANVLENAGTLAGELAENVSDFIKENKLDKKALETVATAGTLLTGATGKAAVALKEVELDKKLNTANKALGEAQLPEKLLTAAALIPGVTIKNPKKAAKQFRKQRAQVLKTVNKQQAELTKYLAARQKEAAKYVKARQKDIEKGKIQLPFVEPKKKSSWGKNTLTILGAIGAIYGGLAFNNARIWNSVPPLESKLPGESRYYRSRQGIIFYKEAGQSDQGKSPVVFVHGIGAGNHSYEWLENFGPISEQYHSYAFDLLGFGSSDKPEIRYTAEVYIKQLTEFLDEVVKQPAIVVASSLSAAYAVQVAFRRPELINKLVLVSPTGINPEGGKKSVQILPSGAYYILRSPVLGKAIYSGIASHQYIRSFMENQMFYNKNLVKDDMVEQYYVSGHQQGAQFAPPSFFTGLLDAEIGQTLGRIQQPILMVYGKESRITPMWEAEALRRHNPRARLESLDMARLLVQWERADDFNHMALDFMAQANTTANQAALKPSDKTGVGLGQTGTHQKHPDAVAEAKSSPAQDVAEKAQQVAGQVAGKAEKVADKAEQTAKPLADKAQQVASQASDKAQELKDKVSDKAEDSKAADKAQDAANSVHERIQHATERLQKSTGPLSEKAIQAAEEARARGEKQGQKAGNQENSGMEAATEYPGDHDVAKEIQEHRETFIGDASTGGALVEDRDKNNVEDRRIDDMG
ncbi:MAG TPA: alpha/beta fold hydrolase [Chloroflexia bacterium]|nr:alpha/beta fold hydrolase [Chloroflexia bacterium]